MPAILRLMTLFTGAKLVISGQSGIGWDDINNLYCFPDTFVALTKKALVWAGKMNPFIKTIQIPNGVDLKKFSKQGDKYKSGLSRPVVLTVGAFTKEKRIDLAIKAVSALKNFSLLVVGADGDNREKYVNLGSKLLGKKFKIVSLPYNLMPSAYREADIFTLPSTASHSFEIAIVEALATGLPVVVNNDPIRKEIVGKNGILVNPEKIQEYAKALKEVWEKRNVMPKLELDKYSWDNVSVSYEKLFLGLVNNS